MEIEFNLNWKKLANDQIKENYFLANKLDKIINENESNMLNLYKARFNDNIKTHELEEMKHKNNILEQTLYSVTLDRDNLLKETSKNIDYLQKVINEKNNILIFIIFIFI